MAAVTATGQGLKAVQETRGSARLKSGPDTCLNDVKTGRCPLSLLLKNQVSLILHAGKTESGLGGNSLWFLAVSKANPERPATPSVGPR